MVQGALVGSARSLKLQAAAGCTMQQQHGVIFGVIERNQRAAVQRDVKFLSIAESKLITYRVSDKASDFQSGIGDRPYG